MVDEPTTRVVQQISYDQIIFHEKLFLKYPTFDEQGHFPFQYKALYEYKQEDPIVLNLPTTKPNQFQVENMEEYPLVCYKHEQHFQICRTNQLLLKVVQWFHESTAHNAGVTKLQDFHFNHPRLSAEIHKQTMAFNICQ